MARTKLGQHMAALQAERERRNRLIIETIRREMFTKHYSQEQLAEQIGVCANTIGNRLKEPGKMRLQELWDIIDALDIGNDEVGHMFTGSDMKQ